jgi:hypothetical protein
MPGAMRWLIGCGGGGASFDWIAARSARDEELFFVALTILLILSQARRA